MSEAVSEAVLGIIGGSGIYDLPGLTDIREERIESPWGAPSDALRIGGSAARRSSSCPGMGGGMCSRRPTSTTAPISTC